MVDFAPRELWRIARLRARICLRQNGRPAAGRISRAFLAISERGGNPGFFLPRRVSRSRMLAARRPWGNATLIYAVFRAEVAPRPSKNAAGCAAPLIKGYCWVYGLRFICNREPAFPASRIPKQAGVSRRCSAGQKRGAHVQTALRYVLNWPRRRVLNALFVICEFRVSAVAFRCCAKCYMLRIAPY